MNEPRRSNPSQARAPERGLNKTPTKTVDRQPSCFIVGQDSRSVQMVSSVIGDFGIRLQGFDDVVNMLDAARYRQPDVIFMDFDPVGAGAAVIDGLIASRLSCPIQLMSARSPALVEKVRRKGEGDGSRMLPVLYEPFDHAAVRQVVDDLGLTRGYPFTQQLMLQEMLGKNWLEAWYQPKIDLRKKCLVGAEIFARARHPEHGVLGSGCVLANATENDLLTLTSFMIAVALRDWRDFSDLCPEMKIAVNIPVGALTKLPIAAIVRDNRPRHRRWPGIILEIKEDEIIPAIALAREASAELSPLGVGLAVDDCGLGYDSLARLKHPPFCELKIDRSFVASCGGDALAAEICETFVALAHDLKIKAVAEGIETAPVLKTLTSMKCDVGQGHLFARPMPKEQLLAQIRQRAEGKTASSDRRK